MPPRFWRVLCAATTLAPAAAAQGRPLVIRDVTIVDVERGGLTPGQTVVIVGNRVRQAGDAVGTAVPAGARVIDGRGKYLMPGLWDMHVHVEQYADTRYPLFVATGVTGVREMGQSLGVDSLHAWRRDIAAGRRIGPRVIGTGAMVETDADGGVSIGYDPPVIRLRSAADARRVVDSMRAGGADFVKIHSENMSREVYFALAAEARRLRFPFAGHRPASVTPLEASDSGQASVEHFNTQGPFCDAPTDADSSGADCAGVAERFRRNGTWFTPTLAIVDSWLPRPPDSIPYDRRWYWPPGVRPVTALPMLGEAVISSMLRAGIARVRAAHVAGVPILAGSDVGPGTSTSVHRELELLVTAGITPAEALRAATLHPARFLGLGDSLGTVAAGKVADLVLLDADPLADITSTRRIRAVVANGRHFDRVALDAILDGLAAGAGAP